MTAARPRSVRVPLGARSYPVRIGTGLLDGLGEAVIRRTGARHAVLVTVPGVGRRYGARALRSLRSAGLRCTRITVPDGDASKNLSQVGELYTALQQGVVDGAENNPPSYYSSRHYEVAPHFVLDEHTAVPDVLLVSGDTWSGLSPQQRHWLEESAKKASAEQRRLWREASETAMTALGNKGVEILIPDRNSFAERLEPLRESYRQRPELRGWIDAISGVQP